MMEKKPESRRPVYILPGPSADMNSAERKALDLLLFSSIHVDLPPEYHPDRRLPGVLTLDRLQMKVDQ